jgi:histidinol-phosphate aminotransferase
MWRVNRGFQVEDTNNYAKHANEMMGKNQNLIDCSLGINPFGISEKIASFLNNISIEDISHYPKSNDELKELVRDYWKTQGDLSVDQIMFTHGGMGACEILNRILLNEKSNVLGYCPQFTEYILDVEKSGANFTYISLDSSRNFQFDPETMIRAMDKNHDVIYLDNPNNPTGQIIPLEEIESIVKKAAELDIAVIVDEVYGDFMGKENSAISLIGQYDNLLIVRSFSKGFGLAGLRIGYVVVPKSFARYFEKAIIAFPINSMGQNAISHVFDDPEFMLESMENIAKNKKSLIKEVKKLQILKTDDTVPIMTLVHPDESIDLQKDFLDKGLLTNSCETYHNLSKNCVRIRIPAEIAPVIQIIQEVEKSII